MRRVEVSIIINKYQKWAKWLQLENGDNLILFLTGLFDPVMAKYNQIDV